MMKAISWIANGMKRILKFHKKKIFLTFFSAFFFALIFFPYDDLADVVTIQMSKLSNNQVFVQFDRLNMDLFPSPGINLEKVEVDTPQWPTIKADELTLSPSILGLLTFKPGIVIRAKGFLQGQLTLQFKSGEKIGKEVNRKELDLQISGLEISHLKEFVELPVKLSGKIQLHTNLNIDPSFRDQPQGEIELQTGEIKLPSSIIPTYYGPLNLPAFNWSHIKVNGRIVGGKFIVETAELGGAKDSLNGQFKGFIDVNMNSLGGSISPQLGAYEMKMKINVNNQAQESLSLFLNLLDSYKTKTSTGITYAVRISGTRWGLNPSISNLGTF